MLVPCPFAACNAAGARTSFFMVDTLPSSPFQDEINRPTIDIPRAALTFARSTAYPTLDVPRYLARLDALAEEARPRVEAAGSGAAGFGSDALPSRVDALSEFLFYEKGFRGNRDRYEDPRNSYLNCVLDRKTGVPITLSVVYVAVARRLGMQAYGVSLPGHFIAGVFYRGEEVLVDPFNTGRRLSRGDCDRLVRETTGYKGAFQPRWLAPARPTDLLARMFTNLTNAYVHSEDWRSAIPVLQHLLLVQPDADFHLRDLGYLYLYDGSLRLAAQYLEEYLRRAPAAEDFDNVRTSLELVAGRLALWN